MADGSVPEFALECKAWWCQKLLLGQKTVEVRQWPLPQGLLGTRIWLAATGGPEGQAALGDQVDAGQAGGELVGWVQFSSVVEYSSAADFERDEGRHCVGCDSPYAWRPGETQRLYGWVVGACQALNKPRPLPAMGRQQRSLYRLEAAAAQPGAAQLL